MPTSNPFAISTVLQEVIELEPMSILDIGAGFGKWGVLFREMLDIWHWRIFPNEWKVKIDCIEGYSKYITPIHEYVYNFVYVQDVRHVNWSRMADYDLICLFDVIEHMTKVEGYNLLAKLLEHVNKAIFITTPLPEDFVATPHGRWKDDLEGHKEAWAPQEFVEHFNAEIVMCDSKKRGYRTFLAKIMKG